MRYLLVSLFFSFSCFSAEPVIDYKNSLGGIATVAGHVIPKAGSTFLITITNGGLSYSTVTDTKGNWGIVFRHLSTQFDVSLTDLSTGRIRATLAESLEH